eukprot:6102126-Pyramimonas_sp.AAC.1
MPLAGLLTLGGTKEGHNSDHVRLLQKLGKTLLTSCDSIRYYCTTSIEYLRSSRELPKPTRDSALMAVLAVCNFVKQLEGKGKGVHAPRVVFLPKFDFPNPGLLGSGMHPALSML